MTSKKKHPVQGEFLDAIAYQEMDMSVTQAFPALNLSTLSYIEKIM